MSGRPSFVLAAAPVCFWAIASLAAEPVSCERCADARALYDAGKAKEAVPILKKEVKAKHAPAEAAGLLAMCLIKIGKRQDAGFAVNQFLRAHPTPAQIAEVHAVAAESAGPLPHGVRFEVPEGVDPPLLLSFSPASYPAPTGDRGLGGSVVLDATVGVEGIATAVTTKPLGAWSETQVIGIEDAATGALRLWRFFPALRDGAPVPVHVTVTGIFDIAE